MNATHTVSESGGLPAHHIEAFLDRLRTAHYSEVSLRKKRRVLCAFSGWIKNRNIDLIDLDESVTARFMKRMIDESRDRVQRARPTLRQFLAYLRAEAIVCSPTLGGESVRRVRDRAHLSPIPGPSEAGSWTREELSARLRPVHSRLSRQPLDRRRKFIARCI